MTASSIGRHGYRGSLADATMRTGRLGLDEHRGVSWRSRSEIIGDTGSRFFSGRLGIHTRTFRSARRSAGASTSPVG